MSCDWNGLVASGPVVVTTPTSSEIAARSHDEPMFPAFGCGLIER
jgi:hypothetical protein